MLKFSISSLRQNFKMPAANKQQQQHASGISMLLAATLFMAAIATGSALTDYEAFVSDRMSGSYFCPNRWVFDCCRPLSAFRRRRLTPQARCADVPHAVRSTKPAAPFSQRNLPPPRLVCCCLDAATVTEIAFTSPRMSARDGESISWRFVTFFLAQNNASMIVLSISEGPTYSRVRGV